MTRKVIAVVSSYQPSLIRRGHQNQSAQQGVARNAKSQGSAANLASWTVVHQETGLIQSMSIRLHSLAVRARTAHLGTVSCVLISGAKARTAYVEPAWALNAIYAWTKTAKLCPGAVKEDIAIVVAGVMARNAFHGVRFVSTVFANQLLAPERDAIEAIVTPLAVNLAWKIAASHDTRYIAQKLSARQRVAPRPYPQRRRHNVEPRPHASSDRLISLLPLPPSRSMHGVIILVTKNSGFRLRVWIDWMPFPVNLKRCMRVLVRLCTIRPHQSLPQRQRQRQPRPSQSHQNPLASTATDQCCAD